MKRSKSKSLKRRVRQIEEAKGAGAITIFGDDGQTRGFNLTTQERLHVLLASFHLAYKARNPDAECDLTPAALQIAKLIGHATRVEPHSRLWNTVAGIVQGAEEDAHGKRAAE
jgi:hypothetical protein